MSLVAPTPQLPRVYNAMVEDEKTLCKARPGDAVITEEHIGMVNGRFRDGRISVTPIDDAGLEIEVIKAWQLFATRVGIL